jgi:hydroxymethylpyrimidine kinase/phosphomethylpyrimidine kinase
VIVAVTAQNTVAVTDVHEVPAANIAAQIDAVLSDIGTDAVKTAVLCSQTTIETVADMLAGHGLRLVVDPVLIASSGARLLPNDAADALVRRLFPLATVVTPNLIEAQTLTHRDGTRRELAEALVALGASAAIVTGGHGDPPLDHLFDGRDHIEIPVERLAVKATHGSGCTHSATLTALLARGLPLADAAAQAARAAGDAIRHGLVEIGAGNGPADVVHVRQNA